MSASIQSVGYQCEFKDSVIDFFYCKKCGLVARQITVTSCCGESYCYACISDTHEEGMACPECGKDFNIYEQLKYQQRIRALRVYCSMKGRGCGWSGTLEQLDIHLDLDQDNCQYVDTKCPLNCQQNIPKNKVEQHVAEECTRRPYVCQHCAFKATYVEVVDTHLPECKYVPLQCPNRCGVTCDREDMEDHMRMCRLEVVQCKFHELGCTDSFSREEEEAHSVNNNLKHLMLTVDETAKLKQKYQEQKFQEQEQKLRESEQKLQCQEQKLQEQEQLLKQLALKQEQKLQEQEQKLQLQEQKLQEQEQLLKQVVLKQEQDEKKLNTFMMIDSSQPLTRTQKYAKPRKKSARENKERLIANTWACTVCEYDNPSTVVACEVCTYTKRKPPTS